jgi:hypothetical protein
MTDSEPGEVSSEPTASDGATNQMPDIAAHVFQVFCDDAFDGALRVLNQFLVLGAAIDWVTIERAGDRIELFLRASGIDNGRADLLLAKLQAMVLVREAILKPSSAPALRGG